MYLQRTRNWFRCFIDSVKSKSQWDVRGMRICRLCKWKHCRAVHCTLAYFVTFSNEYSTSIHRVTYLINLQTHFAIVTLDHCIHFLFSPREWQVFSFFSLRANKLRAIKWKQNKMNRKIKWNVILWTAFGEDFQINWISWMVQGRRRKNIVHCALEEEEEEEEDTIVMHSQLLEQSSVKSVFILLWQCNAVALLTLVNIARLTITIDVLNCCWIIYRAAMREEQLFIFKTKVVTSSSNIDRRAERERMVIEWPTNQRVSGEQVVG